MAQNERKNPTEHVHDAIFYNIVCNTHLQRIDGWEYKNTRYKLFSSTLPVLSEWPTSTTIACWHCCHTFTSTPFSIPQPSTHVLAPNPRQCYYVMGVFCSVNCAKRFLLDTGNQNRDVRLMLFFEMCNVVWQLSRDEVIFANPAPPRWLLTMFGGDMDIETFREKSLVCRTRVVEPPFITYSMMVEEAGSGHQLYGLQRPETKVVEQPISLMGPPSLFDNFVKNGKRAATGKTKQSATKKNKSDSNSTQSLLQYIVNE